MRGRKAGSISLIQVDFQDFLAKVGSTYQGKIVIGRVWAETMGLKFTNDGVPIEATAIPGNTPSPEPTPEEIAAKAPKFSIVG